MKNRLEKNKHYKRMTLEQEINHIKSRKHSWIIGGVMIHHISSNILYIDITLDVIAACYEHKYSLEQGIHYNKSLQTNYNKDPNISITSFNTNTLKEAYKFKKDWIKQHNILYPSKVVDISLDISIKRPSNLKLFTVFNFCQKTYLNVN